MRPMLARLGVGLCTRLGYEPANALLGRHHFPAEVSRWIAEARILASFPGTQIVGIEALAGAPRHKITATCARILRPNVILTVTPNKRRAWIGISTGKGIIAAPLVTADPAHWENDFVEALQWRSNIGAPHSIIQVLTGLMRRIREHPQIPSQVPPTPDEILDEERYIIWRVLPGRREHTGTGALLQKLEEARSAGTAPRIVERWESNLDPAAVWLRGEIVRCNLRLSFEWARNRRGLRKSMSVADLFQAGCLGMFRAVERFDQTQGTTFSTYATIWIRQSITRSFYNEDRIIRLPAHLWSTKAGPEQRQPMAISLSEVPRGVLDGLRAPEDGESPWLAVLFAELQEAIGALMRSAKPREAMILKLRWGFEDEAMTLEQVGLKLGVTRERVRQIEIRELERLSHRLKKGWDDSRAL